MQETKQVPRQTNPTSPSGSKRKPVNAMQEDEAITSSDPSTGSEFSKQAQHDFEQESDEKTSEVEPNLDDLPGNHVFSHKLRRKNVITEDFNQFLENEPSFWKEAQPKTRETQEFLVKSLRDCYLFQSLSTESIEKLVSLMKARKFVKNEVIFTQGDLGYYFYFVEIGKLQVYKEKDQFEVKNLTLDVASPEDERQIEEELNSISPNFGYGNSSEFPDEPNFTFDYSKNIEIRNYTAGDWFGELSLLFLPRRNASVVASTDGILWVIDRLTFKYTCQSNWKSNFDLTMKTLRQIQLLKPLTEEQLKSVAQVARFEEYSCGKVIIQAGTFGDTFYIVKNGKVSVKVDSNSEQTQQILGEDDYFGEISLLHDQPRAATITALEDVTLICLDKSSFISILGPLREVIDNNIRAFVLQDIKIFSDLSTETRVELFNKFKEEKFERGEVIFRQGDIGTKFYVIRAGSVQIYGQLDDKKGELTHLNDLEVGSYFGEMALLYNEARNATVQCKEACECFVLERSDFLKLAGDTKTVIVNGAEDRKHDNMLKLQEISKRNREQEIKSLLQQVNTNAVVNSVSVPPFQRSFQGPVPHQHQAYLSQHHFQQQQQQQLYYSQTVNFHPYFPSKPPQQQFRVIPRSISNFQLRDLVPLCTLVTGTFGRVKLVVHQLTNQTFALKIQSKYQIMKFNLRTNIFNEKSVLMQINHPFIVKLYQTFQDKDFLYMLLELVQGGELFSLLQRHGPTLSTVDHIFYVSCVVSAFEALHCYDILYRDLKPENLMIDGLGYLKLVDFGFAKVVSQRTFTLCGTPEYFSPELVLGKGYGKGNDVWALGILAFELISGYTPFGNADDAQTEIYKKIVKSELSFPRDCYDRKGMHLISKLLDKNEVTRFGCDRQGIHGIKLHPWFAELDWMKLLNQLLKAPWQPKLKSAIDASNFDKYNEKYKVLPFMYDSPVDPFLGF